MFVEQSGTTDSCASALRSLLCAATTKQSQRPDLGIDFAVGRQRTHSRRRRVLTLRRNDSSKPFVVVRALKLALFLASATTLAFDQFVSPQGLEQGHASGTEFTDLGGDPAALLQTSSVAIPGCISLDRSCIGHDIISIIGRGGINGEARSLFEPPTTHSRSDAHVAGRRRTTDRCAASFDRCWQKTCNRIAIAFDLARILRQLGLRPKDRMHPVIMFRLRHCRWNSSNTDLIIEPSVLLSNNEKYCETTLLEISNSILRNGNFEETAETRTFARGKSPHTKSDTKLHPTR